MPIGDLLASITGEKPTTSPTTATRPSPGIPKRKAYDELGGTAPKAPRTESEVNGSSRPNGNSSRPLARPADRHVSTTTNRPTSSTHSSSAKPSSSAARNPTTVPVRPAARPASTSSAKPLPSRPLLNRPATTASTATTEGPKRETKKGSFAEIMARAKAAAATRESFGKIQHKAIEKGLTMKERKEENRITKKGARPQPLGKNGVTAATGRVGMNGVSPRERSLPPLKSSTAKGKPLPSPVGEEKKVKKAALATTGYTGTARPRPDAKPSKPGAASQPRRDEPSRARPRYGGALSVRQKRRDDYDEEMDDFIEYDEDEEEDYGRRPRYDSYDDESDMEAGLTDIDEEERRAEMYARKEDQEQELLEMKLKREKERRKLLAAKGGGH